MHLRDGITRQIIEFTCTYEMVLHNKLLNSHVFTRYYYKMKHDINLNT